MFQHFHGSPTGFADQQSNYVSPLLLTVDLAFIAVTFLYHLRQPNQRLTIQNHRSHHRRHPPRLLRKPTTSRQLVDLYLDQIEALNPLLCSVLEVNPGALNQADEADRERQAVVAAAKDQGHRSLGELHGIPILLKDSIGTKDKLNTACGSYALLGSTVARDSGVVQRLRKAGAIILGKASLSDSPSGMEFGLRRFLIVGVPEVDKPWLVNKNFFFP